MKLYQHTIFLLLCNFATLSSQRNNSNGVQSDLRLVDLYENIKNKIGKKTYSNQKIKGTPYFEKTFKLAEVEYFGELITDKIYIRFNAYNDEMEIASSPMTKSSENILLKNNKVFCIIDGKTYRYLGFKEDNQPPTVGYLEELFKGELFSFYERKFKVYMQATVARTSLERSFPARFVEKIQYYYSINNGEINQIKLSKKNILIKLKPHSSSIKLFMEKNNSKLKSLKDVVEMFNFIDQLQLKVY
ncbi:hypothetical protein N9T61_02845 [Flavobacteriaceae bacterium]|nr:hypothetical protein [Flavobacteriaceae bacterium]